jgi:hypothetical protein
MMSGEYVCVVLDIKRALQLWHCEVDDCSDYKKYDDYNYGVCHADVYGDYYVDSYDYVN